MEDNFQHILSSVFDAKEADNWKVSDKTQLLIEEIDKIKGSIKVFIENSDIDVAAITKEAVDLFVESNDLIGEMTGSLLEIENVTMADVHKSIASHEELVLELSKVHYAYDIVCDIITSHTFIRDFDECKENHSFSRAVENITDLVQQLEHGVDGYDKMDIFTNIKATAVGIKENLIQDLTKAWNHLLYWSMDVAENTTTVKIYIKIDDTPTVLDTLDALEVCKDMPVKIEEFSKFLYDAVIVPIVHKQCNLHRETDEEITISYNDNVQNKPTFDVVLSNLKILFNFFNIRLSIEFRRHTSVLTLLGRKLQNQFKELLVNDCFLHTIPNNLTDLQSYGVVTREIARFERLLRNMVFLSDNDLTLLDYLKEIDVKFADKASQHFLETARNIMLKDLSASMSIGVASIPDTESTEELPDETLEEALKVYDKLLPQSLFYFPRCMISKTAQELLDLVHTMMEQAGQCSDIVSKRLYVTARLIFEMYDAVVPYHHEQYLQTIPQYVALFHNNCMFLAHKLQTLGDKWLASLEGREVCYPISFIDLVPKLRGLGYKHLTIHLQQQRKQILDNIRSSDLNCIVVKEVLGDNAEQAVRQCLRQLQLLKNVWIGVFPPNVFTRLMATLVNMFVEEIIHRVCSVEDISAEMATQLSDMYTIVVKKAPNLFNKPEDIEKYVLSWIKLQELILVLGGSLKDIEKRWNEGTGPLSVHFRTEELRNLIKALFQNTQFRANLLSKIK